MPHNQPWLDDYHRSVELKRRQAQSAVDRVFEIQNHAMQTAIRECPIPLRTRADCKACGNEPCIEAYRRQLELWKETEDEPYPDHKPIQMQHVRAACHADDTNTNTDAPDSGLFARS